MALDDDLAGQVALDGAGWRELLDQAFDADELRYVVAHKLQHIPQRSVAAWLGWSEAKAERVRRRINRRLAELHRAGPRHTRQENLPIRAEPEQDGGSSLRPFFKQRLSTGGWTWALSSSRKTKCPQHPLYKAPIFRGEPMATPIDAGAELAAMRKRLTELVAGAEAADITVHQLRTELAAAETAAKAEGELALVEARNENPKHSKLVEVLTTKLHPAQANQQKMRGAVALLRSNIEAAQDKFEAERRQRAFTAGLPLFRQWLRLRMDAAEMMRQYIAATRGQGFNIAELLDPDVPDDRRAALSMASNQDAQLLNKLAMSDPDLARKLGWAA